MAQISIRTTTHDTLTDTGKTTTRDTPRRMFRLGDMSLFLSAQECRAWSDVLYEAAVDIDKKED